MYDVVKQVRFFFVIPNYFCTFANTKETNTTIYKKRIS